MLAVLLGWTDETIDTSPHVVRVASVVVGGMLAVWLDVHGKAVDAVRLAPALLGEFRSRASSEPELTTVVKTVDAAGPTRALTLATTSQRRSRALCNRR